MSYVDAYDVQLETHERVRVGGAHTVLLVEHDPVITVTRRAEGSGHVLADEAQLGTMGIEVQMTNRGGDVTYHGPGQLVVYPILRLSELRLNTGRYMDLLEQVIIDTVAAFGVKANRREKCTGVWVDVAGRPHKLAAMGVRVKRTVTLHGFAINVTTDMTHFETIVPCGLAERGVTSLRELLGDETPSMQRVKDAVVAQLRGHVMSAQRNTIEC